MGGSSETATFEGKRELPKKSKDLATDIAAMTVDGGVIIYGVGEDAQKRLTILNPIPLANERERIASIVRSSISEPPSIHISTIPSAADPALGYIIVYIPMSPRAPHQVLLNHLRFYGRSEGGNIPLNQGEVERLYARRREWEVDSATLLDRQVQRFVHLQFAEHVGRLHLLVHPRGTDSNVVQRAAASPNPRTFLSNLPRAAKDQPLAAQLFSPDFDWPQAILRRGDGWHLKLLMK